MRNNGPEVLSGGRGCLERGDEKGSKPITRKEAVIREANVSLMYALPTV